MLPVVTIFMFNNRKQQMRMTAYCMIATFAFILDMLRNRY